MSDRIPYEIQVEIIKRLPLKSLIQCRSVSKTWKALIDSSDFIGDYSLHHAHQPHCHLLRYYEHEVDKYVAKYVSFVDDESFPQHNFAPTLPWLVRQLHFSEVVGSSRGLLCLHGNYRQPRGPWQSNTNMAVLWNPSIERSVGIVVPDAFGRRYSNILGFGVCPDTNDPKIVKITQTCRWWDIEDLRDTGCITRPQVLKVFTLSSGVWRSPRSNLPSESIIVTTSRVTIDGSIYWLASNRTIMDDGFGCCNLIMSFDLASEKFRKVGLPDSLVLRRTLFISRLRESLAVIEYSTVSVQPVFGVWMMERGVPNSFTKLFIVEAPRASIFLVLGFRKSGESMMVVQDHDNQELAVYEPNSQQINNLGIDVRSGHTFSMSSYMETLLLLDHSDGSIIDI